MKPDAGLAEVTTRSPELEAEQAVLGGILVDPTRFEDAAEILADGDWFRQADHRQGRRRDRLPDR